MQSAVRKLIPFKKCLISDLQYRLHTFLHFPVKKNVFNSQNIFHITLILNMYLKWKLLGKIIQIKMVFPCVYFITNV